MFVLTTKWYILIQLQRDSFPPILMELLYRDTNDKKFNYNGKDKEKKQKRV